MGAEIYRKPLWLYLLCATALYAVFWLSSQGKLIYTDEVVFAEDFVKASVGRWPQLLIPHPPMYVWLGSLGVSLGGASLSVMRLVGGLCFVASLWLMPLAFYAISGDITAARRASFWGAGIWTLNPLALQGSLLLDIDNTLTPVLLLLLVCAVGLTIQWVRLARVLTISVSVALLLWAKLLPSTVLVLLCLVVAVLWRRWLVADLLISIGLGIGLFLLSFAVFVEVTRFPVGQFALTFSRVQELGGRGIARTVSRLVMGGGITAVWLGIPMALFSIVTVARQVRDFVLKRGHVLQNWLGLFALLGGVLYTVGNELPMGFPRYHYPVVLTIVLLIALELARQDWMATKSRVALAIGGGLGAYFALVAPDPLLPQYALTFETNDLLQRLRFGLQLQLGALVLPFGVAFLLAWWSVRALQRAALLAGVSFCVATWVVTTVAQTLADYATIYEYGRRGGREMGELVRAQTSTESRLVAPMEILWVSQRQGDFSTPMLACAECTAESMIERIEQTQPSALVFTTKEYGRYVHITRDPRFEQLLEHCYPRRVAVGTYLAFFNDNVNCLKR